MLYEVYSVLQVLLILLQVLLSNLHTYIHRTENNDMNSTIQYSISLNTRDTVLSSPGGK